MAKQAKPKPKGTRNDSRKNGKAHKQNTIKHKGGKIDPTMAIIMGKGAYVNIHRTIKTSSST